MKNRVFLAILLGFLCLTVSELIGVEGYNEINYALICALLYLYYLKEKR